MRTTVDLPDDIHARVSAIARDTGRSLSSTLAEIIEDALRTDPSAGIEVDPATGFPLVRYGRGPITSDDVRDALDDE